MKDCRITQRGTHLTFHLGGDGWQWVEAVKRPAGATFALRQYVRFTIQTAIRGELDLAYDPGAHIASFWFTPDGPPQVDFKPVGGVDIDAEGAWSWVVGALGSMAGSSPDDKGEAESKKRGAREFQKSFADGFAVTVDPCAGLSRFGLERPRRGEMVAPDVGETRRVPAEIHPGGLVIVGPQVAERGMSIQVHALAGPRGSPSPGGDGTATPIRADLVCADQAEELARAYMVDPEHLPAFHSLAHADVRTTAALRIRGTSCPVMMVARPERGAEKPAGFDWQRTAGEAARASGGPIVSCEAKGAGEKPAIKR